MPRDFYDLLDVSSDATQAELKAAYRAKAREYHPDVNPDARASAQFKTVRRAYEVLTDETERAAYDRMGHERYVAARMGGLPAAGEDSDAGGSRWQRGGDRTRRRRKRDDGERTGGANAGSAGGTSTRGTASASTTAGSAGSSRSAGPSGKSGGGTAAGTGRRSTRGGPDARRGTRATQSRRRRDNPLFVAWASVVTAVGLYLVGMAQYAAANADAVVALAAALGVDPLSALGANHGLGSPRAFAVSSVTPPSAGLLFPVAAVVLAVTLVVTVSRFGRGTAWLYPAAAATPVVGILAWPSLPSTAAVALLVFVVLPVGAASTFVVDVGRYLRAAA